VLVPAHARQIYNAFFVRRIELTWFNFDL
jgi:hypothetical protein